MDSLMDTLKRIVDSWDIITIVLVIVFFPWSLIWIGMRFVQEWN